MRSLSLYKRLLLILVIFPYTMNGQCRPASDTTINRGLKLCVYEALGEFSVETFVGYSQDSIDLVSTEEGSMPLPIRFQKDRYDFVAVFINKDTTEILLAGQTPGLYKNQYQAFFIAPITDENKYVLRRPQCIYTHYDHFETEGGCFLNMSKGQLRSIMGWPYSVSEDGNWEYSFLSNPNDPELVKYCTKTGKGDVLWNFFFEDDVVACIEISCVL